MSRFRRIIPVVGVALGVVLVPPLVSVATSPPETTEPSFSPMPSSASESSAPASSDPVGGASGARRQWLEFTEEADPASYAGGASLRDLVAGERVLMIGDSVMASTSSRYGGEMCQELVPRGWHVEMDAESGRFVDFGDRVLDSRLDAEWDAAVVMLGNNYGADKTVFADYLEDIVDRLAPRPTVLLTVTEFRPDRADVNDTIYEIAAEYDNVRVVDWAAETAADPALVGGDGLHLSDLGRARYADLVGGALGRAPGVGEGDCLGSDFTDDSAVLPEPGQVTPPPNQFPNNNNNGGGGGGGATTQPAPPPTTVAATPTTVAVTPTTVVVPVEPPPEEPPPDEPPPDEPPDEPPPDEPPPDEPPPSQGS
jgi:hypothetical protein